MNPTDGERNKRQEAENVTAYSGTYDTRHEVREIQELLNDYRKTEILLKENGSCTISV